MNKETIIVFADRRYHRLYKSLSIEGEKIGVYACQEPMKHLKDCQADLVLIDCGVNTELGFSLLKNLKVSNPHIPVLFVSDISSQEIAVMAFKAGARDYLQKPVNIAELKEAIITLLNLKRGAKEKRSAFIPTMDKKGIELPVTGLPAAVTSKLPASLLHAIKFMEENLSKKIRLADCAQAASMSRYHFCRKFKKYLGMSPIKFLTLVRLNKAKIILTNEDLNITEVAEQVGFNDIGVFSAQFKKYTGLTPTQFRRLAQRK